MTENPYKSLNDCAFWKKGVEKSDITFPEKIYNPKWKISDTDKIATMGSCFAQHIAKWLRENGFNAPFYEADGFKENEQMFSANYGNVYTVRQAVQLIEESVGLRTPSEVAWFDGAKFIDAIRPNSIKGGFVTSNDVIDARKLHLTAVQNMVKDFDVLIFTLGLTETWEIKSCGTIVPTAPGVLAGEFDPEKYQFLNFRYNEIMTDLYRLCEIIKIIRNDKPFRMLLTVSPVPLTATATNQHVLVATTYSKAVLRSVAEDFVMDNEFAQYFPSFEIINNPAARSDFFETNLRSVKLSAVGNVMKVFSSLGLVNPRIIQPVVKDHPEAFEPDCEDALLDEFSKGDEVVATPKIAIDVVCVGDSHLGGFRSNISAELGSRGKTSHFFPSNWGKYGWLDFDNNKYLTSLLVNEKYKNMISTVSIQEYNVLVLVGLGLAGDAIIRCHGMMSREESPKIPIKTTVDRRLIEFYKPLIHAKLHKVRRLDEAAPYKNIFWIAGSDMCVDVAKFRLGETFVNSGSYLIHKKAYRAAFNECAGGFKRIQFIFHDDSLCDPTGFTSNSYLASNNPFDIHCNSKYYNSAVSKIVPMV